MLRVPVGLPDAMSVIPPASSGGTAPAIEASRSFRVGARVPGLIVLFAGALYLGTLPFFSIRIFQKKDLA